MGEFVEIDSKRSRARIAEKKYADKNRDKRLLKSRLHQRKLRKENPKKSLSLLNDWMKKNPEKVINASINRGFKKKYGITLDEYNILFEAQNGNCKICGRNQSVFKRKLSVDHCHTTLKVRGLLCHNCNTAIGMLKDDISTLQSAIKYLQNVS